MYYKRSGQMDLTDRVAIETGLCRGESFKKIAHQIGRHPSTERIYRQLTMPEKIVKKYGNAL